MRGIKLCCTGACGVLFSEESKHRRSASTHQCSERSAAEHLGFYTSDGRELLAIRRTDIQEPISDSEMGTLVAAQSRALGRMSEEIASAIRELHSREK